MSEAPVLHSGRPRLRTVSSLVQETSELCEEDAAALRECGPSMGPELTQLRTRHHKVARLMAAGMPRGEIADLTGYTEQTLAILFMAPAFKELVDSYARTDGAQEVLQLSRLTRAAAGEALHQLHKRIHLHSDDIPTKDLGNVTRDLLDRSGVGPHSKVNVSHGIDPSTLEAIKAQGEEASAIIDIEPETDHETGGGFPERPGPIPEAPEASEGLEG